ncbi:metal-dependent hydrolase [Gloeobacter kilaueensis]|uniref:UPF0173 metal-dependent hydrolase GKIL_2242 n=1 Tax=Gloeobacter kilaueensis (strain ATCC BAA-2537 / CCAP 1431/1 / ULC 316 / JS1) TaxID=1183438 RepID=U5QHZ3_GLOK1|nr:metal-dependent hydrolase [Gloeobacter kilaueensis]AGY58488.1 metal-dependent hydrolase [Gloeobacter kilaueensis JS1]
MVSVASLKRSTALVFAALLLFIWAICPGAAQPQTQLVWYGQSAFKLVTPAGHVLFIDPWLLNPVNKNGKNDLAQVDKADLILISHGHFDHVGQAGEIARRTGAKLVTTLDLGNALARYGGFPKDQMSYQTLGNFGGVLSFFDGEVKVALVPAVHSSHVNGKDIGATGDDEYHWGGAPAGFVIVVKGGPTIYHTGDTDLFGDMRYVPQFGKIDLMLACIGDHFTMGPARAAEAVALVDPAKVVPMHYGTFVPLMTGTPEQFASELKQRKLDGKLLLLRVGVPMTF